MMHRSSGRPVFVAGVGMTPYSFPTKRPHPELALPAVRAALDDAGVAWTSVDEVVVGTTGLGMAVGRATLRALGPTTAAFMQVENASASGSFAFRAAAMAIASGRADIALALGVDKYGTQRHARESDGLTALSPGEHVPLIQFALLTRKQLMSRAIAPETLARVAVKAHANAALNPNAQSRKAYSLEEVLGSSPIAGDLTMLQCCPRGEGAAAAILCSERALPASANPVRIIGSSACSEPQSRHEDPSVATARLAAERAYFDADIQPCDLDVVELHDAFPIEEVLHSEAFGLTRDGFGYFEEGGSAIGGSCAINPSGGLIGQGHPLGPTGLGQIHELVLQLRGKAGPRQQPDARLAMAHMIGLGTVGIAHILRRM